MIDFKDYSLNWKAGVRDFERGQQDHIVARSLADRHLDQRRELGLHRARHLQDAGVPGAPADRHREQERQPAAEFWSAVRWHDSRRGAGNAARDGRMAQGEWRGHLRDHAVEDVWRGTDAGEGAAPSTTPIPSRTRRRIFASRRRASTVYAIGMACPKDGKATIHSLGWAHEGSSHSDRVGRAAWIDGQGHLDAGRGRAGSDAAGWRNCKYAYALKLTPAAK